MLCHFLFPIISHNVGIINPRKCGFISLRLDVKMKCELIGQVYATADINRGADASRFYDSMAKARQRSLAILSCALTTQTRGYKKKTDCTVKWSDPGEKYCVCDLFFLLCVL